MNKHAALYEQRSFYVRNGRPYQSLSLPWWVKSTERTYPVRHGNRLEPLICGEAVFRQVEIDLRNAQSSVDLISWGFDPGMVLTRSEVGDGVRFGDLLIELATRKNNPVFIRLLIWHDDAASEFLMKNMPGYYGQSLSDMMSMSNGYYNKEHQKYNCEWFAKVISREFPKIHLATRLIASLTAIRSIKDEKVPENLSANVAKKYAAHHQKSIIIDYERKSRAIGYVMGHNCVTDFWDTANHIFQDPRRERFYKEPEQNSICNEESLRAKIMEQFFPEDEMRRRQKELNDFILRNTVVAKPYQDISCRISGSLLHDLNHNFCQAWKDSHRAGDLWERAVHVAFTPLRPITDAVDERLHQSGKNYLEESRKNIRPEDLSHPSYPHSAQLLRTQPQYEEKTIKECYANLTRLMHNYMFIQNQYIQYEPWAELLMASIERKRKAGYLEPIYIFVITSTPERPGMDLPTYDVAKVIGYSEAMKVEHEETVKEVKKKKLDMPLDPVALSKNGINVLMGSMWTCSRDKKWLEPEDYEEIYIHAKVAIVDDVAFTIGSANLNVRSMAMDSELNLISQAADVAYDLRRKLFDQCLKVTSNAPYVGMRETYGEWMSEMKRNFSRMRAGGKLVGGLVSFYVDRKPADPVV
ncbi:phospholipase D-like domain-containing protein [Pseudoduganella ginsengisoli]